MQLAKDHLCYATLPILPLEFLQKIQICTKMAEKLLQHRKNLRKF